MTQKRLCRLLGCYVSPKGSTLIADYEYGRVLPSLDNIYKLAKWLQVDREHLFMMVLREHADHFMEHHSFQFSMFVDMQKQKQKFAEGCVLNGPTGKKELEIRRHCAKEEEQAAIRYHSQAQRNHKIVCQKAIIACFMKVGAIELWYEREVKKVKDYYKQKIAEGRQRDTIKRIKIRKQSRRATTKIRRLDLLKEKRKEREAKIKSRMANRMSILREIRRQKKKPYRTKKAKLIRIADRKIEKAQTRLTAAVAELRSLYPATTQGRKERATKKTIAFRYYFTTNSGGVEYEMPHLRKVLHDNMMDRQWSIKDLQTALHGHEEINGNYSRTYLDRVLAGKKPLSPKMIWDLSTIFRIKIWRLFNLAVKDKMLCHVEHMKREWEKCKQRMSYEDTELSQINRLQMA